MVRFVAAVAMVIGMVAGGARADTPPAKSKLAVDGFPVAVWLQDPRNVDAYKDIGIIVYVGLWEGPTAKQLGSLQKAGMKVICEQNAEALKPGWKGTVVGFMHGDEPDNAQEKADKKGYGPPVLPSAIVEGYRKMKAADDRPVILNLGQGVAWDGWYGRGVRTNKPEDYAEYAKGSDIVSFDIYPACHDNKEVAGKLWYVGKGVERLKGWAAGRPVWACIETTHIGNPKRKATPEEVREEVWMAIANGATGIVYFAHEFKPKFVEAGLLADKEMAAAVKRINTEVQAVSGAVMEGEDAKDVSLVSIEKDGVKWIARRWKGSVYVIAAGMSEGTRKVTVTVAGGKKVETLAGEEVEAAGGKWEDEVKGYAVKVWKVEG